MQVIWKYFDNENFYHENFLHENKANYGKLWIYLSYHFALNHPLFYTKTKYIIDNILSQT